MAVVKLALLWALVAAACCGSCQDVRAEAEVSQDLAGDQTSLVARILLQVRNVQNCAWHVSPSHGLGTPSYAIQHSNGLSEVC